MTGWILGLIGGVFGAVVGSFLNVCSLRWPLGASVVGPGSRCPHCETRLPPRDLVPILSWLWLRGRCRHCTRPISLQYPLVELGTAVLWGVILVAWGVGIQSIHTIVFLSLLLAIALSDARFYRIPNPLSLGGAMAGVFLQALPGGSGMGTALLGSLGAMFVMQAIRWTGSRALGREAMGGGDVRMMALIGAFLGFEGAMGAVFLASALGLVVFAPTPGRTGRLIPFGVFLAVAGAFVWLVDPSLFTRSGRPFSIS